jgi:hypothetical protein
LGFEDDCYDFDASGVDGFVDGDSGGSLDRDEVVLDYWLSDIKSFRQSHVDTGNFSFSEFLSYGFIFAILDAVSGAVLTLYQHAKLVLLKVSRWRLDFYKNRWLSGFWF